MDSMDNIAKLHCTVGSAMHRLPRGEKGRGSPSELLYHSQFRKVHMVTGGDHVPSPSKGQDLEHTV